MKNVIIISDTHNKTLPKSLVKDIKDSDILIHAGDLTSMEYYNKLLILTHDKKFFVCLGNMDKNKLTEIIPLKEAFKIEEISLALMHGWGSPKNLPEKIIKEFDNINWDILIFGHTHKKYEKKENDKLILNPGSPTEKRFAKNNSYIKMQIDKNSISYQFINL